MHVVLTNGDVQDAFIAAWILVSLFWVTVRIFRFIVWLCPFVRRPDSARDVDDRLRVVEEGLDAMRKSASTNWTELVEAGKRIWRVWRAGQQQRGRIDLLNSQLQQQQEGHESLREGVDVLRSEIQTLRDEVECVRARNKKLEIRLAAVMTATNRNRARTVVLGDASHRGHPVSRGMLWRWSKNTRDMAKDWGELLDDDRGSLNYPAHLIVLGPTEKAWLERAEEQELKQRTKKAEKAERMAKMAMMAEDPLLRRVNGSQGTGGQKGAQEVGPQEKGGRQVETEEWGRRGVEETKGEGVEEREGGGVEETKGGEVTHAVEVDDGVVDGYVANALDTPAQLDGEEGAREDGGGGGGEEEIGLEFDVDRYVNSVD